MVAGIQHLRLLPTAAEQQYALQPAALEAAMAADEAAGLLPCYVCATIGTTSSCAVDPVGELAAVGRRHNAWCARGSGAGCCDTVPRAADGGLGHWAA